MRARTDFPQGSADIPWVWSTYTNHRTSSSSSFSSSRFRPVFGHLARFHPPNVDNVAIVRHLPFPLLTPKHHRAPFYSSVYSPSPERPTHSSNSCPLHPAAAVFVRALHCVTMGFSGTTFTNSHAQPRLTAAKSKFLSFRSAIVHLYARACVFVRGRTKIRVLASGNRG